jgi:hypothetical protein
MTTPIHRGIDLRHLLAAWTAAGGQVEHLNRTGEDRLYHPRLRVRSGRFNARRKDTSRKLVSFVNRVLSQLEAPQ